jgi:hypothetical protein
LTRPEPELSSSIGWLVVFPLLLRFLLLAPNTTEEATADARGTPPPPSL